MGILAAEVAGGALGPHSRSAVGEANGGARFLRRFASYQGIARRKISLLCNDVIRNVHCLQQALTRLGVIRRFTRLAPLRLAAAGLTSGCPAFNLLELLRLHFGAGRRRLDRARTLAGGGESRRGAVALCTISWGSGASEAIPFPGADSIFSNRWGAILWSGPLAPGSRRPKRLG